MVPAAGLGLVLGILGAKILFVGSGLSLVPWALAGMVIGWSAGGRRKAAIGGATYGFVLAFAFMVASYDGAAELATRLLFFLALAVVGACGGLVTSIMGAIIRRVGINLPSGRHRS